MSAATLFALFFLVTLLILWIVGSVVAHKELAITRSPGTCHNAAQHILLTWLALPAISVVWTIQTMKCLRDQSCQARRSLGTGVRSLCKALIRGSARKWCLLLAIVSRPVRQNDLEMSRIASYNLCERMQAPSRLLQIPVEVRELIIRMSVVHYDVLDCRPTILLRPRKQFRDAMAFIRTCRQLYQEGRMIVLARTLFHVWTRSPFYRQLKPAAWNELTMIHLAAQLNNQHTSRLAAAIRDLNHMGGLRDIYLTIWDFIDFQRNEIAVASVFGPLRNYLQELSLVQVNIRCARTINHRAELRLKTLIMVGKDFWPRDRDFGILRSLQGPVTKWRAFIKLQGYETKRAVGTDEDLVALPWDGELA
jgi:hypothetical protein